MYTKCVWYISCVMSIIVCHIWESTEHFGKVVFHMICGESSNVPGSRRWMNPTCLDSWLCDGVFFAPWVIGGWNDHSQRALNCRRFNLVWWVFLGSSPWSMYNESLKKLVIFSGIHLLSSGAFHRSELGGLHPLSNRSLTFTFHWWLLGDPTHSYRSMGALRSCVRAQYSVESTELVVWKCLTWAVWRMLLGSPIRPRRRT